VALQNEIRSRQRRALRQNLQDDNLHVGDPVADDIRLHHSIAARDLLLRHRHW
jgi:hypothetical protein